MFNDKWTDSSSDEIMPPGSDSIALKVSVKFWNVETIICSFVHGLVALQINFSY